MLELKDNLKKLGLTGSEIRVYLYLLEVGSGSPPQIAKGTGIARANCYYVIAGLQTKGLIGTRHKGKRVQYIPKDPQVLLHSLENRKATIESLIPDLQALYGAIVNKPRIHFYEGFEEVKSIYRQSLQSEYIKAFGSTKQLAALDQAFFTDYFKEAKKRGIILRDIVTYESKEKSLTEARSVLGQLYEPVLLPEKYKGLVTDILLWDNHVALITLKAPIFGTVLTNSELSKTFNVIHDALFEQLRTLRQ